jgi:hypothetical protein
MRIVNWLTLLLFLFMFLFVSNGKTQNASDYLVLSNIGEYQLVTQIKDLITLEVKQTPGYSTMIASGVVIGADHFNLDHQDQTYKSDYESASLGVEVQVTQHSGTDSDKWLQHEVESDFRDNYGLPGDSYVMRVINGNTVMAFGAGGWDYRWLSDNKVIDIKYTDLQMTKPEPLEVVNAYLAKHPSTLPLMTSADLRTDENKTKWIKDEMERRLWLCDKWLQQLDEGKTEQYKALSAVVNGHLKVFLDYREKYYGISAGEEKQALYGYLQSLNEKEIRKKLTEYKQWWAEYKTKPINLP